MTSDDFNVDRSWAAEPLYYRAPTPPDDVLATMGMEVRPYQLAGVEYCLSRDHGLVGDAPGVGKTAEGILISNALRARRTLVVCPASLRLNWEREVWAWSTTPNVRTYPTMKAADGVSPQADYQIISYDLLRRGPVFEALMDLRWDHLILDEAHYIKDPRGNARSKAICGWHDGSTYVPGLRDVCGRVTMLSGTILPNQPIECYNALRLLDWDAIDGMSLDDFREYYYDEGEGFVTRRVWDRKENRWTTKTEYSTRVRNRPRNLEELGRRLRSRVMVRRLKEHVLPQLPRRQWHVVPLAQTAAIRRALKHPGWALVEHMYQLDPDAFDSGVPVDGEVSTARRELGEAKAPEVAAYVHELLGEGVEKLVVGAWHHTVLQYLLGEFERYGVTTYMSGRTSTARKQALVDDFQENPATRVILGQVRPLGLGWTLTAAQDVVLAEPEWVPGINDQLLDRVHRSGQRGSHVIGHVPVVPGTLDERVLATAIEKDISIHKTLDERR